MSGVSEPSLKGLRILVAEDESVIAFDLISSLERFGCEPVGPAKTVEQVVSLVEAGRLDGALLDVNLRGRQVFEVLPRLIAVGLKFVLISGYDKTLFPPEWRDLPRLTKPFNEASLRQVCVSIFGNG